MPHSHQKDHAKLSLSAGFASVAVALSLVALKLWAMLLTGSLSIGASLADSAMDLLMSLGAAIAILYASRPADEDHAFGHTAVEDLVALAQAVLILISVALIGASAVMRLRSDTPTPLEAEGVGMAVMLISIAVTLALVWWQGRVARLTGNRVVAADRLHYLGDLLPALGALVALVVSSQTGASKLDAWLALLAALYMVWSALKIGKGAWDALMDRSADPKVIAQICEITGNWPGVLGYHDLKTRTSGSRIFVNLHIELDGDQSLREAHDIGAGLKRAIVAALPQADVIIHKDVVAET